MMTREEIKTLRKALGLNTKAFGERIGVSGRTVEDWEQGRRIPAGSAVKMMEIIKKEVEK